MKRSARPELIPAVLLVLVAAAVAAMGAAASNFYSNAYSFTSTGTTFAKLNQAPPAGPPQTDGTMTYCSDCQRATSCAGGGNGTWALRIAGTWNCAAGTTSSFGDLSDYLGPIGLAGNSSSGTDSINNVNINGQLNVTDSGVLSTSTTTETATTTASNTSVSLGAVGDFATGQGVLLPHAGPTASVTAPTDLTGSNISYTLNPNPSALLNVAYPCNVDSSNASCTTSYTAVVMAVDAEGGWSPASSAVTVTSGPATLSVNNGIYWSWTSVTGATGYIVLGCTGASCTPTAFWAVVPGGSTTGSFFWDFGNHFGSDITYSSTISTGVQGTGANQDFSTTITGVSGNKLTLAAAPSVSGTFTIRHDNAPIVGAAIAARASSGGDVLLPIASTDYPVSQINFAQTENVTLGGTPVGKWGASATKFDFIGSAGRPMVYMDWAAGAATHDWMYDTSSTPAELIYIDADSTFSTPQRSKGNEVYHISASPANPSFGAAVTIGINSDSGENEFVYVHDNTFGGVGYQGVVVAAGFQTDNTEIDRNGTPTVNFGYFLARAGTVNQKNNDCGSSYICHYNNAGFFKNWNIDGDYGEGGSTYWLYDGGSSNLGLIRVSNSAISGTPGPNGYFVEEPGEAIFESNSFFCNGSNNCLIGVGVTHGTQRAVFIGNEYGSGYPVGYPSSIKPPYGLPITDSGGANQIPQFISLGDILDVSDSFVPIGDIFNGELSLIPNGTPLLGGATASLTGGTLATGSNSLAGNVTAAASNVLTPGFTCPNAVVLTLTDNTTMGGAMQTASTTTTATFTATASDSVNYSAGCR